MVFEVRVLQEEKIKMKSFVIVAISLAVLALFATAQKTGVPQGGQRGNGNQNRGRGQGGRGEIVHRGFGGQNGQIGGRHGGSGLPHGQVGQKRGGGGNQGGVGGSGLLGIQGGIGQNGRGPRLSGSPARPAN